MERSYKSLTIDLNKIGYLVSLFILHFVILRPQLFVKIDDNYIYLFMILQIIIVLFLIIISRELECNSFLILTVFYFLWCFIDTFIHGGAVPYSIQTAVWGICAIYLLLHRFINDELDRFISFSSYSVSLLIWINLATILRNPEGIISVSPRSYLSVPVFFLGQANQYTVLLFLSAALIIFKIIVQRRTGVFFLIFSVLPIALTIVIQSSATCKVAFVLLAILIILYLLFPRIFLFFSNPVQAIILVALIFILLTRILTLDIVSDFITGFLGKDLTLSERTTIWMGAYQRLRDPSILFFGLGETSGNTYIRIYTGNSFSAHNLILQILLSGGLVLLAVFIGILAIVIRQIVAVANRREKALISILLFVFGIINMTEVFEFPVVLICLFYFYIVSYLLSIRESTEAFG